LTCHSRSYNQVRDKNQQAKRSANPLITSSKKKKDMLAMFDDAVLAVMRKLENKNQEKQARWQ
jgi:16S rRNA U1498 N3-methylase RsmE